MTHATCTTPLPPGFQSEQEYQAHLQGLARQIDAITAKHDSPQVPSDADRYQTLLFHEEHGHELTPAERAELRTLRPRVMAERLSTAIYSVMGGYKGIEDALPGVAAGLTTAESDDPAERTRGYAMALQSMLAAPRALVRAVEYLYFDLTGHEVPRSTQQERNLSDVTHFMQDLVTTLTLYVDEEFIAPKAMAYWVAGRQQLDVHDLITPENQGPRRLGYLWLLDALMQSPDALIEAMIAARSQLVAADEALQPFAEVDDAS